MTSTFLKRGNNDLLIDIGANFGYFSVLWLSQKNTRVIAIEPVKENHELLTANVRQFGSEATVLCCCLGDHEGSADISHDPNFPMLSKIVEKAGHGHQVRMRTLNAVWQENGSLPVEMLKCDAEGYDVRILNSARDLFQQHRIRSLIFEPETFEGERDPELYDFCQFLEVNGYRRLSTEHESDLYYSLVA